jgi:AcrR family transcriptional regulator
MARPVSIRDESIIAAAREVFLERGIQATTAEVAERAGVSEGSVFKRFKTKAELFEAAMGEELPKPAFLKNLTSRVGKGTIDESLFELGMEILAFFRELIPLMMMAWSNPGPNGLPARIAGPNPPPVRALNKLAGFFEAEMQRGRLRRHDAEVVARTFVGALHHFAFFELLQVTGDALPLGAEQYVRGLVSLMIQGIGAAGVTQERAPRSRTRSVASSQRR